MKFICKQCFGESPCIIIFNPSAGEMEPCLCPFGGADAEWKKMEETDKERFAEMKKESLSNTCIDACNMCNKCHDSSNFEQERKAATPEPNPTGTGKFVLFEVMKDICDRADAGQKKYGTMLRTDNGRDALNDALQEAIDLVFYLKQAIMERDKI